MNRPACEGQHELFDSTNRRNHERARAICATCPVLAWCAVERNAVVKQKGRPSMVGTWAGVRYGRPEGGQRILEPADEPTYTAAELRALHARYAGGERTDETRIGERIYQRQRKARNRKAAA